MSFAFCSALRRNVFPVTMLRFTAVPTRKQSLNASFSVSAASALTLMANSVAESKVAIAIRFIIVLLRHEFENFSARMGHGIHSVGENIEFAVFILAQG